MDQTPPPPPPQNTPSSDDKNYALFIHLSIILASFITLAFIGPVILWLIKKDQSVFIDTHGKEALNFSISWTIWLYASTLLACLISCVTFGLGLFIPAAIMLVMIILAIIAAIAASDGRYYKYPLTIRFIK